MKRSNAITKTAIVLAVVAVTAMSIAAQDNNKKKNDNSSKPAPQHSAPAQQHSAPPAATQQSQPAQHQHSAPPAATQQPQSHTPPTTPAVREHTGGGPQQPQMQHGAGTPGPRNDRPNAYQPGTAAPNHPGGPAHEPGRTFGSSAAAPRITRAPDGGSVHRNDAGRITAVHTSSGATIYHSPSGVRRVEMARPGGAVVVASAPGHGYVQRPMVVNNTTIVKRTYVVGGVSQVRVYRPVVYSGVTLHVYTPVRYYHPAFYAYAYTPWRQPVVYNWGWMGRPWYAYYGGYFAPYPVYASPTLWLTDFLIATTLEAAYLERMAANAPPPPQPGPGSAYAPAGQVALTPEVKQAIADEVHRQIELERAESQQAGNPAAYQTSPIFTDNARHVFLVSSSLEVNSNAGACVLAEGDVIQLAGPPPPNSPTADTVVLASHRQDCRKGSIAAVQLQDLQEMQNQMRATIDKGMGDLQTRQGQGGMPALPAGAAGTVDTPLAAQVQPDPGAGAELTQASQEAGRAEEQVLNQTQNGDGASGPVNISMGQSIGEVTAILGTPEKTIDLGAKKIYVYKDIKITFVDGRVSDVQ